MKRIIIAFPLLLAGCGTLPQPLLGHPGRDGARLAIPPPPVLMVPSPQNALLSENAATLYARDLANALVKQNVPSIARPAAPYAWRLTVTATSSGPLITPEFAIVGPNRKTYGHAIGTPVPASGWANGNRSLLKASAFGIAPELAKQLGAINAAIQQSNPRSLANRPPRVRVMNVSGAPGDGDHSLALDVSRDLPKLGVVIVSTKDDADFVVDGVVTVTPNAKQRTGARSDLVELVWTVRTQTGQFIGKVTQLHDLEPSEMTPYWGDVAAAAAQQAALGIRQVMSNATPKPAASASANKSVRGHATLVQQPEG